MSDLPPDYQTLSAEEKLALLGERLSQPYDELPRRGASLLYTVSSRGPCCAP